jgi:hypothetical protein
LERTTQQVAVHTEDTPADALTIASIGILVHILTNILHEGAGHGGACLLVGANPLVVSTVHMECSTDTRLVTAGGTIVNVAAGALFFVLGRLTRGTSPRLKYFWWLSMTVNLFVSAGYLLFSGIGGFGDWAMFIQGLSPQWAWRAGMTLVGAAAYMLVAWFGLLELRPLIGSNKSLRYSRAKKLARIPYFAGGILACIAGSLNPQGLMLIVLSAAAATFGGTSGLLWMTEWLRGSSIPPGPESEPLPIRRSWPAIVTACILAVAFVVVLGPGLRFAGQAGR